MPEFSSGASSVCDCRENRLTIWQLVLVLAGEQAHFLLLSLLLLQPIRARLHRFWRPDALKETFFFSWIPLLLPDPPESSLDGRHYVLHSTRSLNANA